MTPNDQRIAIAEVCGWERTPQYDYTIFHPSYRSGEIMQMFKKDGELRGSDEIPDYLNDLNAMHDAEKQIPHDLIGCYTSKLAIRINKTDSAEFHMEYISSTAEQRAEAFLKTLGKWYK